MLIAIGRIAAAWGLKGWVRVEPLTDFPERFRHLGSVYVVPGCVFEGTEQAADAGYRPRRVGVAEAAVAACPAADAERAGWTGAPGRRGPTVRLRLTDCLTRTDAERLRGAYLCLDREELPELAEGSFYVADLIGLNVFQADGMHLGRVVEVLRTPANDVWVVESPQAGRLLVPALRQVVRDVDIACGKIVIEAPPGLVPGAS